RTAPRENRALQPYLAFGIRPGLRHHTATPTIREGLVLTGAYAIQADIWGRLEGAVRILVCMRVRDGILLRYYLIDCISLGVEAVRIDVAHKNLPC
ncbi:MAG: hypothetical protein AVDCRST_MAG93-9922, partial [uncultured Chloroflexia bacterium]